MLAFLRARALNRGLLGGSKMWVGVGAFVWTLRLFQWLNRPEASVIYRDKLGPGEAVVIRHQPPGPTRRQAKKAAKRARQDTKDAKRADRKASRGRGELPADEATAAA